MSRSITYTRLALVIVILLVIGAERSASDQEHEQDHEHNSEVGEVDPKTHGGTARAAIRAEKTRTTTITRDGATVEGAALLIGPAGRDT